MMLIPAEPITGDVSSGRASEVSDSIVNFDANASYGIPPELHNEVAQALGAFCNPSAVHRGGQQARALLEEARWNVKELIGASAEDTLVFTSGATEANNSALHGVAARGTIKNGGRLLYGLAEHASVVVPIEWYSQRGWSVVGISPVELRTGKIADVQPNTAIAAFMAANNESGEIFDVAALFRSVKEAAPLCHAHCDLVQLPGKVPVLWRELGADSASVSGHKIGSYPGVGALVLRPNVNLEPFIFGGPQELRHRAGTENLPGIVSFGLMARRVMERGAERIRQMDRIAQVLVTLLSDEQLGIRLNFTEAKSRLPNTLSITVFGVSADDLVVALDIQGIAVSSGAACASGKPGGSHVLRAYGFPESEARETIRVSITGTESDGDIERFIKVFGNVIVRMRKVGRSQ
jgi:cysteine desulfurase